MKIEDYAFGRIVVDGVTYTDDIKIIDGEVKPQWFRKTGHRVEVSDISDLLEKSPELILFGKGASGNMAVSEEVAEKLEAQRIEMIAKPTQEAVEIFNRLAGEGRSVAAGFHLTC
jgi:hypothetical protein